MNRHEQLLDEVRRYAPADALETLYREQLITLLTVAHEPFSRNHFEPGHVTASCFIFDRHNSALLLHRHRRLGRWLQMGGHVEGDESPARAALREGAEESGLLDLSLVSGEIFDLDVHGIPAAKGEPDHRHFDVRYIATTATPHGIAIDPEESEDLAWVPLDRAEELMNEEASSRVIRKIRSRL